ncbi:MAG: branched-chain-amino-acid transaminase [Clostridiales bacterium]|jgi:branched-chain amino acid aminotransferase|nr:branched-chain-amino-acid transaminase [Clostridiales bacterium]
MKVYLNGNFVDEAEAKVSVFDHGLLYGDGVFEGIRAYGGRVFQLEAHIRRLFAAAKAIDLAVPMSKAELAAVVTGTLARNRLTSGYIRLVVTRGKGDLGLSPATCKTPSVICIAADITLYPKEMYEKGMPIVTASARRNNATIVDPQIKSLNYLNNILAKIEANRAGVPEALLLTDKGIVAECTGDNIFIVTDGEVWTPPIHVGILDGITRRVVIGIARRLGYTVREKEFTLFNLYSADECFLTGTAAEAIAVTRADGRVIGQGVSGPVTNRLLAAFREEVLKPENGMQIGLEK